VVRSSAFRKEKTFNLTNFFAYHSDMRHDIWTGPDYLRNINLSPLINIGAEKSRSSQEAFNKRGTLNMLC
jgi:hypothetical protein